MDYSQAAGGLKMENLIKSMKSPDYGSISILNAANASAVEKALMALQADVKGTKLMSDAEVKAAQRVGRAQSSLANTQGNMGVLGGITKGLTGFISAIPTGGGAAAPMKAAPGWSGGDISQVNYDDLYTMSGDSDYANTIMNGGAMEWSSDW